MSERDRPGVTRQLVGRALGRLEESLGTVEIAGQSIVPSERLDVLEAVYEDHRVLRRELDTLGYSVFDYLGGQPSELNIASRRKVVQQARYAWTTDPQAGAAVELMNDFCFGRGIPKPRANDPVVQDVIDAAWDDPDNQEVLTSFDAQVALGTDLALQSNLFVLMFDDGDDGKVKLSLLSHDDVVGHMPHPTKRHRVLYYLAFKREYEWDFKTDGYKPGPQPVTLKPFYYEHWRNVELTKEEPSGEGVEFPPANRVGEGKVYHVRMNRHSEQVMGVCRFSRTLRWYTAYNDFVAARLDVAKAGAAFIMKRKVTGSAAQMAAAATRALGRSSPLASSAAVQSDVRPGPRTASILEENEGVTHENFSLDSRAGNAQQDARMIRAPISAAERWTQAYLGDAEAAGSLAGATSLELPILKAVESRQEIFEKLIRWFVDRVIERAVDSGAIPDKLTRAEVLKARSKAAAPPTPPPPAAGQPPMPQAGPADLAVAAALQEAAWVEIAAGREVVEVARIGDGDGEVFLLVSRDEERSYYTLVEAHEDAVQDEKDTSRDLGYDFSMPSPLRRMMGELILAIQQIATTFDPNNENMELSRALLTIALGEGLEVSDAPGMVEKIFPPGWVPPSMAAAYQQEGLDAQGRPVPSPTSGFGPADQGKPMPHGPDGAPPGAPANARMPEDMGNGNGPYRMAQGRGRMPPGRLELEEAVHQGDETTQREAHRAADDAETLFEREVIGAGLRALEDADLHSNGNGRSSA